MEQFSLPFEDTPKEESPLTKEDILQWTPEQRISLYKELIGQEPFTDMAPEQIAKGILDPETERTRVLQKNLEEDREERAKTYFR